jgi:rhamnosyltransferase
VIEIATVTVIFNPDDDAAETINMLAKFGYLVIVISNGASDIFFESLIRSENLIIRKNDQNIGLSLALNQGIELALSFENIDGFVLFDQDSKPTKELPLDLQQAFWAAKDLNPACISPELIDLKLQRSTKKIPSSDFFECVKTVATSGTYIARRSVSIVGLMDERFFIDGIDHEWCFRATSMGFSIVIAHKLRLDHNMGDFGFNFFGKFKPAHKSPIRHYYIIRNTILLARMSYIPLLWRFQEGLKTLYRVPVYLWLSSSKYESLVLMLRAFADGFFNRFGKFDGSRV